MEERDGETKVSGINRGNTLAVLGLVIAVFTWAFAPSFYAKAAAAPLCIAALVYLIARSEFTENWSRVAKIMISVFAIVIIAPFAISQLVDQWEHEHPRTTVVIRTPNPSPANPAPAASGNHQALPKLPESSIRFAEPLVVQSGQTGSIPGFDFKFSYLVVGPAPIKHVHAWSALVIETTHFSSPTAIGKYYRAFESHTAKNPNAPETPEMDIGGYSTSPQEILMRISPTGSKSSYAFIAATWLDRNGISGKSEQCLIANSLKIDTQTKWSLCQVEPPSPADLKYESMTAEQLLDAAATLSTTFRQSDKAEDPCEKIPLPPYPSNGTSPPSREEMQRIFEERNKVLEDCESQRGNYLRRNICPNLSPLIEELMFRVGYSPYDWLQLPQPTQSETSAQNVSLRDEASARAEMSVRKILSTCESSPRQSWSLQEAADTLDILDAALRRANERGLTAPFNSRPHE